MFNYRKHDEKVHYLFILQQNPRDCINSTIIKVYIISYSSSCSYESTDILKSENAGSFLKTSP